MRFRYDSGAAGNGGGTMKPGSAGSDLVLTALQVLFYVAFVFLWFKDNYLKFRPITSPPGSPSPGWPP